MTTLNTIIKDIRDFCTNHAQINTFFSGKTWNFQTKNNIYPAVILIPSPSSISENIIYFTFQIFVVDKLNADRSNLDEIYSDTAQIMSDIVAEFNENDDYDYMLTIADVNIEPIEEVLDDILAGWVTNNFTI